jgi:RNA polymerase sigma-70 factor (ECF subfamily)
MDGSDSSPFSVPARPAEIDRFTLRAARRGDRHAFDAIVALYTDRLRLLAFHLLHDPDLIDDALQDAFFNAYRGLPAFRGGSSLGTWLYRITYTVCLGYLRRRKPPGVSFEDVEQVLAADGDLEESFVQHDRVTAALATLTPEQRAAVLLVDLYGYDYGSAGDVLDVPRGTVASRLNVARASLRSALSSASGASGASSGPAVGDVAVEQTRVNRASSLEGEGT